MSVKSFRAIAMMDFFCPSLERWLQNQSWNGEYEMGQGTILCPTPTVPPAGDCTPVLTDIIINFTFNY